MDELTCTHGGEEALKQRIPPVAEDVGCLVGLESRLRTELWILCLPETCLGVRDGVGGRFRPSRDPVMSHNGG